MTERYLVVHGDVRRAGKSERTRLIVEALRAAGHEVVEANVSEVPELAPSCPLVVDDPLFRAYLRGEG